MDASQQKVNEPKRYSNGDPNIVSNIIISYFDNPLAFALVGLTILLVVTRAASSRNTIPETAPDHNGAKTVAAVPYWLPYLGHLPNMAWDAAGFTQRLRDQFTQGVFALSFGATTHHIIYHPELATSLLNQKQNVASSEEVSKRIMTAVFGFPAEEHDKYDAALPELTACYKHILSEPSLGKMVAQTAQRTKGDIKDLVTGNESPVDQMPWEKTSKVRGSRDSTGETVIEASLLPLIRDFVAYTASPAIMGSDFLANNPTFFEDLWTLNDGFLLLATGLPRWLPIPTLTRAHIARKRLLDSLTVFHEALEKEASGETPGSKWSSLDDVGDLVKSRMPVYRKHGFSLRARAAVEHALMWAANANSDALIFWMINRIYADKALLAMLREEIQPFITGVQPESSLAFAEAPRLEKFDVQGLLTSCPLLKSCYLECLRLDTAPWSLRAINQDVVVQGRERDAQGWLLRKGGYAHAAHDLHNTDPRHFDDAMTWRAARHVRLEGDQKRATADTGSMRPYGGGSSMCKGRAFAFKECMMFAAAIIAMWDIQPAGSGEWKMPRHKKATGVYNTSDQTRVWVRQRQLSRPSTT
ncbi:hypothetical protein B0A50_03422 [Salinomyces thailandicus]|uniref:Cytochrome P450 n=1 Tax=Salinomyces thailandicus TaxID=706561 RepID=A0A4U0U228_9PEZI|nr:hypothetical protein B0A50_03422 [Salinomyces thailandica]